MLTDIIICRAARIVKQVKLRIWETIFVISLPKLRLPTPCRYDALLLFKRTIPSLTIIGGETASDSSQFSFPPIIRTSRFLDNFDPLAFPKAQVAIPLSVKSIQRCNILELLARNPLLRWRWWWLLFRSNATGH